MRPVASWMRERSSSWHVSSLAKFIVGLFFFAKHPLSMRSFTALSDMPSPFFFGFSSCSPIPEDYRCRSESTRLFLRSEAKISSKSSGFNDDSKRLNIPPLLPPPLPLLLMFPLLLLSLPQELLLATLTALTTPKALFEEDSLPPKSLAIAVSETLRLCRRRGRVGGWTLSTAFGARNNAEDSLLCMSSRNN